MYTPLAVFLSNVMYLLLFVLLSLSHALPFSTGPRAANADLSAQVVQSLNQLSTDLHALNNTLNSFQPDAVLGLLTAVSIQQETQQLNTDIQHATSLTHDSTVWSQPHSLNVATAIINIEPQIFSVLSNIVRHKPAFATAVLGIGDLSQTVENDLITQRDLSKTFGAAVVKKLDPSLRGLAPAQTQNIVKHFNKAIQAYKSCTGLVCLPPFPSIGGLLGWLGD
jgi:Hydrophobic surface binding protein A